MLPFSAQTDKSRGPTQTFSNQRSWSSATTHLGYKTTLTLGGHALYENTHATTETASTHGPIQEHPDTPPPVCKQLCVSELLAAYYRGQANPAPVFSAVKQLGAHKLLTS